MSTFSIGITINAPIEAVWEVVAHRFDRVGEWAAVIPSSRPLAGPAQPPEAPTAGRVCRTGMVAIPEITERLVAYDEAGHTFVYEAANRPRFVASARNRWSLTDLPDGRTGVRLEASLHVRGLTGWVLYPLLRFQITRTGPRFLADLQYYVENGCPSPRKQRQLRSHAEPGPGFSMRSRASR